MKKYYIAGIVPETAEDSGGYAGYSVYIPDFPQIAAGGEDVAEAIDNAASALYLTLTGLTEQNTALPEPLPLEKVRELVAAERAADDLPCPLDTIYQYISVPLSMFPALSALQA